MIFRDIIGLSLLIAFTLAAGNLGGDPGVGWHLRAGELISQVGLPTTEPFLKPPPASQPNLESKSEPGRPWVNDQWLADVVFWRLFSLGGLEFLQTLLLGMAVVVYVGPLGAAIGARSHSGLYSLLVLLFLAPTASLQWFVRPVVFSFLGFSIYYLCLNKMFENGNQGTQVFPWKRFFVLNTVFLLWVNLHPGFLLGFLLQGFLIAALSLQGRIRESGLVIIMLGTSLLLSLMNPYGPQLHKSIFDLLGNTFFMQLNSEWLSPDFSEPTFWPFLLLLLILSGASLRGESFGNLFQRICLLAFVAAGLMERRMLPYAAIVALLPLSDLLWCSWHGRFKRLPLLRLATNFPEQEQRWFPKVTVLTLVALLFLSCKPGHSEEQDAFALGMPTELITLLREHVQSNEQRIFHSPDLGGKLIWARLFPSIDDRNQVLPQSAYEDYLAISRAAVGFEARLQDYSWAVLAPSDPLRWLISTRGWIEVAKGKEWILYSREGVTKYMAENLLGFPPIFYSPQVS